MTIGALAFIAATAAGAALGMQSTGGLAAGDKAAIEKIVRDYILEHPEIIPEAVERLQAKRVADSIGESRKAIETPYAGAWEGAANGDVTLVEFFDYACGYCRASLADLAKLVGEDKGLKVVYRELLPVHGVAGADHVLIGRSEGIERDFALLRAEMTKALGKVMTRPVGEKPRRSSSSQGKARASTSSARTEEG